MLKMFSMSVYDKVKWVIGILMIFVLIIATNLIDRENFTRVKNTVSNIYKDRLIAKDLIFKISNKINEKEVAAILKDVHFFEGKNIHVNTVIDSLLYKFEQTNLTKEESVIFSKLKNQINSLKQIENNTFKKSDTKDKNSFLKDIAMIKRTLVDLSKIQLTEGSRQVSISKKALSTIKLFTQIEIYFLVFLAIIVQIIIVYDPKSNKKEHTSKVIRM